LVELISKHGIEIKLRSYKLEDISKMIDDNEKPEKKGKFVISFAK
jgi:D-arabinose 1-dehydrogenase-like Zn-dependent alcohol dehydrogenase